MIISFPTWTAAWTNGDRRRRPWRAVTKRSVIEVRLLDISALSVARENGKAEENSTGGTTDPPLLYLPALTFTRESQDFVIKDPNRYEDVLNISEDVPN